MIKKIIQLLSEQQRKRGIWVALFGIGACHTRLCGSSGAGTYITGSDEAGRWAKQYAGTLRCGVTVRDAEEWCNCAAGTSSEQLSTQYIS